MDKTNFYRKINANNGKFTQFIRSEILNKRNVYKYFQPDKFQRYAFDSFLRYDAGITKYPIPYPTTFINCIVLEFTKIFRPDDVAQIEYDIKSGQRCLIFKYACIVYYSMIYIDGTTLNKLNNIYSTPFRIAISKLKRNKIVNEGFLLKLSMKQSGMF